MAGGTEGLSGRGGGGGGAGPGVSPTDKLLFTVQIYDSFYVPNRKALRFIGGNGTVGNTPGDWQIQLSPPLLPWPGIQVHSTWPSTPTLSGKRGCCSPDEGVHNSARYGQLMARLIKKRAIKIGWANG